MADRLPAPPSAEVREQENTMKATHFSSRWLKRRLAIIMIFFGSTTLLFWSFGAFSYARPYQPQRPSPPNHETPDGSLIVNLPDYGSFQGTQLLMNLKKTETFSRPVDAWMNVEYSTQPVGQGRFMPVTWPEPFDGTKDATSLGPACFQNMYGSLGQSEACDPQVSLWTRNFRPWSSCTVARSSRALTAASMARYLLRRARNLLWLSPSNIDWVRSAACQPSSCKRRVF
jgi:acetylcholinesterase